MNQHGSWPAREDAAAIFEPLEQRHYLSAELVVSAVTFESDLYQPGDAIALHAVMLNVGVNAVEPGVPNRVQFILSRDTVWGNEDDVLLQDFVDADGIGEGIDLKPYFITADIPADTPAGQYFVAARVDVDNAIPETHEGNNTFWSPQSSVMVGLDPDDPALADGSVRLRLVGPGEGQVHFAQDLMPRIVRPGQWVLGRGTITSINLIGTTAASRLQIVTADGVWTDVDMITVDGSMGAIAAPTTRLTGNLGVDGTLGVVRLAGVSGYQQQRIIIGSDAARPRLVLGDVMNLSIESAGIIRVIRATQWLDTNGGEGQADEISAPRLGRLIVTGDGDNDVAGDFMASLVLGGDGGRSLGRAVIAGDMIEGGLDAEGVVGTVRVGGNVEYSSVSAPRLGVFRVGGDLVGSELAFSQPPQAGWSLGRLIVGGWMLDSSLDTQATVRVVAVGGMDRSEIYVGNILSFGELEGMPAEAQMGGFDLGSWIGVLVVRGVGDEAESFRDTNIATSNIRRLRLSAPATAGEADFGVTARRVERLELGQPDGWSVYRRLREASQSLRFDSLVCRIV
jgi:hypothetical protein